FRQGAVPEPQRNQSPHPMKKKLNPQSAFFNPRFAIAVILCLSGVFIAFGGATISVRSKPDQLPADPTVSSLSAASTAAVPFTFSNTGNLNTARFADTATLLPNGMVLIAGGGGGGIHNSAELYDPGSGSWTITGSLNAARYYHTATLLPNGNVLVVGGLGNGSSVLTTAELYNPANGTWSTSGSLNIARYQHTATLLPNGMVLV